CLVCKRGQPLRFSFFCRRTIHVQCVLKILGVGCEMFVAIFKRFVVTLQRDVVVHVQNIGQDGIVALVAGSRGKLVDQRELLCRIGRRVDLRQRVVHLRPRLDGNILANLLRGSGADSEENQYADEPYFSSHGNLQGEEIGCILVPRRAWRKQNSLEATGLWGEHPPPGWSWAKSAEAFENEGVEFLMNAKSAQGCEKKALE